MPPIFVWLPYVLVGYLLYVATAVINTRAITNSNFVSLLIFLVAWPLFILIVLAAILQEFIKSLLD